MHFIKNTSIEGQPSQTNCENQLISTPLQSTGSQFLVTKISESIPSLVTTRGSSIEETPLLEEIIENIQYQSEIVSKDKVLDVLPSYELFNCLHKNIPQETTFSANIDLPPFYRDNDSVTTSNSSINLESQMNENEVSVNEIYNLPKANAPVKIEITLTKDAVIPPLKPVNESVLREYRCGDIVHGYVIVENKSNKPIRFEMFYVTLEGYISTSNQNTREKTIKRFLRMVDMSASWSYTNVAIGTGLKLTPGGKDFDNSILGLNHNRFLQPGVKYKKIFMFKLPTQLLDNVCDHEDGPHSLPPPSFGFDNIENFPIKINEAFGYGHTGVRGSPLLTYDYSGDDIAIMYSINAKLLGKNKMKKQMNILQDCQYHMRFIPFEFRQYYDQFKDSKSALTELRKNIKVSLNHLKRIFADLDEDKQINFNISSLYNNDQGVTNDHELKKLQLVFKRDADSSRKRINPDFKKSNLLETDVQYTLTEQNGLLSKFFSDGNDNKSAKSGVIIVSTEKPHESLAYWSPKLIRKNNNITSTEYNINPLKSIILKISCLQSINSANHIPPDIKTISTQLLVFTTKSNYPIPIALNSEFVMNLGSCQSLNKEFLEYKNEADDYHERFKLNKKKLKKLYHDETGVHLRFGKLFPERLYTDLKSLATLQTKLDVLGDVFEATNLHNDNNIKIINRESHNNADPHQSSGWKEKKPKQYERKIKINLNYLEDLQTTLVPSFESCLCSRLYMVRITILFNKAGSVKIDVPVDVSK